jgi:anti-anti-sigma regulatory factor
MRERTLSIGNELNRKGSRELRKALKGILQEGESVCFDASRLQHADAAGLAELFALIAEVLERGGEAFVAGASARMRAIFELVQLDHVAEMRECNREFAPMQITVRQISYHPSFADNPISQMAS